MKRLTNFAEKTFTVKDSIEDTLQKLKNAIGINGKLVQESGCLLIGKGKYGLQTVSYEFEIEEAEEGIKVIARGASSDIGNRGAMKVIERIVETMTKGGGGTSKMRQKRGMSKTKIGLSIIAFIGLVIAIPIVLGPSEYYGRYDYINGNSNNNTFYELYKNGRINYHSDDGMFLVNRSGTYSLDKTNDKIIVKFSDGRPPFELVIQETSKGWEIVNGTTFYIHNEKFSIDGYK